MKPEGVMLLAGVGSGVLSVTAISLRAAKIHSGPFLSLAALVLCAIPLTVGMAVTVFLRREVEAEIRLISSAVEAELARHERFVTADLVNFGRLATLPGLLLGTLGWTNSEHRGTRAGGWLLAGIIGVLWLGSFAFELRVRPPTRYPPGQHELWEIAIAHDKHDCFALLRLLETRTEALPPELESARDAARQCALSELAAFERLSPEEVSVIRRRERLLDSPFLREDEKERLRKLVPTVPPSPGVPTASAGELARIKRAFERVQQGIDRCLDAPGAREPIVLGFVIERDAVRRLWETTKPAQPNTMRCLMLYLSAAGPFGLGSPVQAELTFRRSAK